MITIIMLTITTAIYNYDTLAYSSNNINNSDKEYSKDKPIITICYDFIK